MDATLYSLAFDELSGGAPVYKESFLGWDDSSISSHNLSLYVAARPRGLTQSLTLTASLPPKDESYSAGISLNAGPATLAASGKVFRGATDEDFSASPVTATLAVGSASAGPRLADTFVYDPEAGEPVSNTLSASWGGSLFSSSFTAKRSTQYRPTSSGWSGYGGESFRPSEIKASLNPRLSSPAGAGRFSWTLAPSLSLSQDLLKFSTSALALGLSATLNAGKDFSLTVSAQSQNSSAWRYYPYLFEDEIAAAGRSAEDFYVSPLEDLWNSISLWDTAALERGLVKLKSLSLEAKADLHDWTLTMTVSANPKLADDRRSYYLDASFSMALVWKDFSDIRADIKMNGKNGLTY
jgi:hypothetical protein